MISVFSSMPSLSAILIVALTVWGLAWIIADSKISFPVRVAIAETLGKDSIFLTLLECPPCLSFWLGLGISVLSGLKLFSIAMAFICTGFSLLCWTYVEGNRKD